MFIGPIILGLSAFEGVSACSTLEDQALTGRSQWNPSQVE